MITLPEIIKNPWENDLSPFSPFSPYTALKISKTNPRGYPWDKRVKRYVSIYIYIFIVFFTVFSSLLTTLSPHIRALGISTTLMECIA